MAGVTSLRNVSKLFYCNSIRQYSLYPSHFIEPITGKKAVDEYFEKNDKLHIQTLQVKAAGSHQTCSVFYDNDVQLLIRYLMRNGNRTLARSLVEKAFETIKRIQLDKYYSADAKSRDNILINPVTILHKAVENCTPVLNLKKVKRSGTLYLVPTMVFPGKAKFMAMNFILEAARDKSATERYSMKLAHEILNASKSLGKAFQRKMDLHKQCEANRSFAHFRWG